MSQSKCKNCDGKGVAESNDCDGFVNCPACGGKGAVNEMDVATVEKLAEGMFERNRPLFEKLSELEKKDAPPVPKTRVVYCHGDTKSTEGYVYIGRPSKWGNPFKIGEHGNREEVIRKFREWLLYAAPEAVAMAGYLPPVIAHVRRDLRGKVLACWCKRDDRNEPCHGDVLAEIADSED
jgi:uncharacterized Zn finger protein (UPF0148 family)